MSKRVHFEDNLFYLNVMTRAVRDGLLLDLDPDIFLERLLDDIGFIDTSLDRILSELERNDRLIERHEQLLNMSECETNFQAVFLQIQSSDTGLAQTCQPFMEKFRYWQERSRTRIMKLDGLTRNHRPSDDDEALVSTYELNELLKDGTSS